MQTKAKIKNRSEIIALAIFVVGILTGLYLAGTASWADQETLLFNFGIQPDEPMKTLDCPVWLSSDEVGVIRMSYTNTSDRAIDPLVRVQISEGRIDDMREFNDRQTIEPGQTASFSWEISKNDAVYDRFVMFRIYAFRSYTLPALGASCGVYVVNIPGVSGRVLSNLALGSSLILMILGFGLYFKQTRHQTQDKHYITQAMGLSVLIVCLALIFGLSGNWVFGWIMVILGIIMLITLVLYAVSR